MTKRGFAITRLLNAPRPVVWRAWTEAAHLSWFFNPDNPAPRPPTVDLRVGGAWRIDMVINADTSYVTGGIYREIVPVERLVMTWGAIGGWPNLTGPDDWNAPLWTVILTDFGRQTRMEARLDLPDHFDGAEAARWFAMGIEPGFTQTLDRLVAALQG